MNLMRATLPLAEIDELFEWHERLKSPFDVRVALDEIEIWAGDLDTMLEGFIEEAPARGGAIPPVAVITRSKMTPKLDGYWHIFLRRPTGRKEARVSIRVFESTYDALDALLPTIPRDLIEVLP